MGLISRLTLGWGKVRRTYIHMFNREYIRRNHARRRGKCTRCGACCELMFRCPYLSETDGKAECVRHGSRWENCRIFPVDERDLADRDLVSRNGPCGYSFDPPMASQRWLIVAVAALVWLGASAEPTVAAEGRSRVVLRSSFREARLPEGWVARSGVWEPSGGGLRAPEGGELTATFPRARRPSARRARASSSRSGSPSPTRPMSRRRAQRSPGAGRPSPSRGPA